MRFRLRGGADELDDEELEELPDEVARDGRRGGAAFEAGREGAALDVHPSCGSCAGGC